ncbi:MAG: TetR/AcrR family transcriptional regulator, partial [Mycobacterium sp.]
STVLERYGMDPPQVPPLVWSVLMTSVSRVLVMEQALGMSVGHAEIVEFVERYLHRLEGDPEAMPAHQ